MSKCQNCVNIQCVANYNYTSEDGCAGLMAKERNSAIADEYCPASYKETIATDLSQEDCASYACFI